MNLESKSVSKSQQRLMGMAWAYRDGALSLNDIPEGVRETVKNLADSMKKKDLSDFAHTKHTGLPEKVTFIADETIKLAIDKKAFNKENPVDLFSQLIKVLSRNDKPELQTKIEQLRNISKDIFKNI